MSGNKSSKNVKNLIQSMKANGWQGSPISVIEHKGAKYILDGHHRAAAARRAGVNVPYNKVPESGLSSFGYKSIDDVIQAASEAGPNRLRL
nr:ParB N-terminal domain-containing protein [Pseudobacteriovorax antillogorgiicola]